MIAAAQELSDAALKTIGLETVADCTAIEVVFIWRTALLHEMWQVDYVLLMLDSEEVFAVIIRTSQVRKLLTAYSSTMLRVPVVLHTSGVQVCCR
ncbi:MAG: hypothetical protein A2168_00700 [Planctomycetes bacterium RBG_13_50_24]|nr:MAG: hypothetical protein A2168_00700 [Planctomycetes bacterium RBG_13_50_24]